MNADRNCFIFFIVLLCFYFCYGQGKIAKPKFPSVFQVGVQGIFKDVKKELVGTIYYDSIKNRGAFHFTYEGITKQNIYRFDDDELLHISGKNCTVTSTEKDNIVFFPFTANRNGKNILAKPEELFAFTNSTLVSEESDFPSYTYKAKWKSEGGDFKCELTHVFTKPEMEVSECDSNICQPTLSAIDITCLYDNGSWKAKKTYNFFRFKSEIADPNVFLPPSGVFCNVKSKENFPGLSNYFSFTYDLVDERKGKDTLTMHKKVWYDSINNIIRMDEFDAEMVQIASRVFDINGGVAYNSRTSLSACEIVSFNSKDVNLDELAKLPAVFFQGNSALNKALFVGTRRVHGQDYEVWSLLSNNQQTSSKIVQEFYFTKRAPKSRSSEILKLSGAELYTYGTDKGNGKSEQPVFTYLPVNNLIDRLRWDAFDVSPCFKNEQKKEFRLKVDGPPTTKDSKIFQEVLNELYTSLVQATNISAVRLTDLACVHDGVKITEFTGLLMDKPQVISSVTGKYELNLDEAYRMIEYLAGSKKLALRMSKDGQIVDYKITAIEEIKHEEEDKNLYSGGVVAGVVFGGLILGSILGVITCYKCSKIVVEENDLQTDEPVQMADTGK